MEQFDKEVFSLMVKNHSQLEISKMLGITIDQVIKCQTRLINGNKNTTTIESSLANITLMEAKAFEIANNYTIEQGNEFKTLLNNLENARI